MDLNSLKIRLKSLPFIGWFARWVYNLAMLNRIKHNLYVQSAELENIKKEIIEQKKQYKQLAFDLSDQLDILEQKLEEKASVEDTTKLYEKLLNQKEKLLEDLNRLDKIANQAEKLLSKELSPKELKEISNIKRDRFAPLYRDFEEHFRGKREDVKSSLEIYLPFVKNLNIKNIEILDLGCGRGEWLELLKENGFKASGVDLNENMIQECIKRELKVYKKSALEYIKNLPSSSLAAITGFHIIEHFENFDAVLELLEESFRVLKKGGIAIFETPNIRNILVGANDFYLDPTHNKPLHPLTMEFFLSKTGFINTKILAIKDGVFTDIKEMEFNSLEDYIKIGRNYALIGYKP